ncbi:hypothetical protein EVAR_3847_1 [Eumeta japonica]|uniref:Uncharacterized protein n=1 Tax=Eumeta variegata TaxID=151549 RepID=A0A4C1ST73_EUMVA|nr:hypothetical protein EVAR_3847_1 [Eumeta japonica]
MTWLPSPMHAPNPRRVISAFLAFWEGIEYLMELNRKRNHGQRRKSTIRPSTPIEGRARRVHTPAGEVAFDPSLAEAAYDSKIVSVDEQPAGSASGPPKDIGREAVRGTINKGRPRRRTRPGNCKANLLLH